MSNENTEPITNEEISDIVTDLKIKNAVVEANISEDPYENMSPDEIYKKISDDIFKVISKEFKIPEKMLRGE